MSEAASTDLYQPVGALVSSRDAVAPSTLVSSVVELFFKTPTLDALAVVDGGKPRGLVTRQKVLFKLFRRFGFELYGRQAVTSIADASPIIASAAESLDVVLDRAMSRPPQDIYDDVLVVDDAGDYQGLLSVKQMVLQQGHTVANVVVQKELAQTRAQELERVSLMKSQFIANVTHELRSPVNAVIELGELIRLSAEKGYVEQVSDRLALLMSCATNLRAIITNILDLSKIEAGRMKVIVEPFDLAALVDEVVETTRVLLGARPVSVEASIPCSPMPMSSDPVKVRQVLVNLASNAAKFTERGRIVFTVRPEGAEVAIAVSDTGIGIRADDRDKLFLAFSQIDDPSIKRHDGTGLGLAITRQLVEMLHGRVGLESELGTGSTFTVHLPLDLEGSSGGPR